VKAAPEPIATAQKNPGSLATYIIGFVLSVLLTLAAYVSFTSNILSGKELLFALIAPAIAQLLVQLVFFLHLGKESRPRWNLTVFLFMLIMVGIVVIGSLWIMHNLDYHMMPHDAEHYLLEEEAIRR